MSQRNSFKQMIKSGVIKRLDSGMFVRREDIHIEPGFNLRNPRDPENAPYLEALVGHMARGGKVPALEVRPRDDGGVWLVDGEFRLTAYGILADKGQPVEWIAVVPFEGNDIERTTRIMTSNESRKLTPLQIAEGYRRLRDTFNLTPDDIARRVIKTRQHVDQMLILANAPHQVQQMVQRGDVSASVAIDVTRQHGEKAKHILADAKAKAGGQKVTPKSVKPWTPPVKVVVPALNAVSSLLDSIDNEDRARIEQAGEPHGIHDTMVSVNARELFDVFRALAEIEAARKAAEEKQRAKAAKAAQGELKESGYVMDPSYACQDSGNGCDPLCDHAADTGAARAAQGELVGADGA
jgi:ParB-like chromosome segregation protein Spo0J